MWVVFVLAALVFTVIALVAIYIGNKTINAMKRDDRKLEEELKRERHDRKGENE